MRKTKGRSRVDAPEAVGEEDRGELCRLPDGGGALHLRDVRHVHAVDGQDLVPHGEVRVGRRRDVNPGARLPRLRPDLQRAASNGRASAECHGTAPITAAQNSCPPQMCTASCRGERQGHRAAHTHTTLHDSTHTHQHNTYQADAVPARRLGRHHLKHQKNGSFRSFCLTVSA